MIIGLRGQQDSDFGSHFAPKIGVRGNLLATEDWKGVLRANYGQGYRVPNLKERHYLFDHSSLGYMVLGNPDLEARVVAQLPARRPVELARPRDEWMPTCSTTASRT